jgi:type IV secretory pathway TraG/TraD family ATPase VirD4
MYKFGKKLFAIFGWIVCVYLIAMQFAYFLSFHYDIPAYQAQFKFVLDPSVMFWQGNDAYFKLVSMICLIVVIMLVLRLFVPDPKDAAKRKAEREMTTEEKLNYKHTPTRHEVKKGLQRLQFTADGRLNHKLFNHAEIAIGKMLIIGTIVLTAIIIFLGMAQLILYAESGFKLADGTVIEIIYMLLAIDLFCAAEYLGIGNKHIRDYSDQVFDHWKKIYNNILWHLKKPDSKKLNTLKTWSIDHQSTYWRSGIPVLTKKHMVWVDPQDSHTLVIGTSNSGKTWSVIDPMIEFARMCGESMVIADLKGEQIKKHKALLDRDGYNMIVINFIDPEKGDQWNPFGLAIKQYRKVQKENEERIKDTVIYKKYIAKKKELFQEEAKLQSAITELKLITDKKIQQQKMQQILASQYKAKEYHNELQHIVEVEALAENIDIHPDYSEALQSLTDIAYTLAYEPQAKDPYWWQMSQTLIEGGVLFLLEQEYLNENGELCRLSDDQINFKNIKMLIMDGKEEVMTDLNEGKKPLLKFYLDNFRLAKTDESVDRLASFVSAPEDTMGSIMSEFSTKIKIGTLNNKILKMTSSTSFNFQDIGTKKTAVFLEVQDDKSTYYEFLTVFMKQLYEEIVKTSREESNLRLPIPVRIIWDEFGISPALVDVDKLLSAGRSKGVVMTMVIQDFSQIDHTYGRDIAKAIKNNVMNLVYVLGGDPDTLKEVSERAGFTLKWNRDKSNMEKIPLISTDRLATLSIGEVAIIRQRVMPVITRLNGYDKYPFYAPAPKDDVLDARELPRPIAYSITDDYYNLTKYGQQSSKAKKKVDDGKPHQPEDHAKDVQRRRVEEMNARHERLKQEIEAKKKMDKEKKKTGSYDFIKSSNKKEEGRSCDSQAK